VLISDVELVDVLNRAIMMLYAPRLEPFELAPLEGNACGLPVIAVAEGEIRETIVDGVNGLLVDPDPEAMASTIRHLLDDDHHARALGEAGVRFVNERWSLDAAERCLEEHLEELVPSSRRADQERWELFACASPRTCRSSASSTCGNSRGSFLAI